MRTAKCSADPFAASHELEWARGDLLARRCDAYDATHAPATMSTLQGSAHDASVASACRSA